MSKPSTAGGPALRAEVPRKAVHAAVGLCALFLRWIPPWLAWAGAGAAVLFNAFFVHRATRGVFLRPHERGRRFSTGVLFYPVVVLALFLVFAHRLELAAGAFALLAFGDAAATLGGLALGGPALPWNPRKRWSGLLSFTVVGGVAAALLIRWTQLGLPSPWVGRAFLEGAPTFVGPGSLALWLVSFKAAGAAAVVESLDAGIDDNVLVAATGALVLWLASLVGPDALLQAAPELSGSLMVGLALTALPALAARLAGAVSTGGASIGWLLTAMLYAAAGWPGLVVFGTFFVLGAGATRVGWTRKASLGIAQEKRGRRGVAHAVANTLAGLMGAYAAALTPYGDLFRLAMVAAFATAAFDTVATEIGQAFGRHHVLSTTLRRVPPGTVGAVSFEGSAAGLAAAAAVALVALAAGAVTPLGAGAAVVGALVGSSGESMLGATLPAGGAQQGDVLNFLNTALGAAVACGVIAALSG